MSDTFHQFLLNLDPGKKRLLKGSIFLFPLAVLLFFAVLRIDFKDLFYVMIREDSFVEYTQALTYLLSSLFGLSVSIGFFKARNKLYGSLYLILSLGLFLVCMEEISWGQRIFKIALPDYFEQRNIQREITVHNLDKTAPYVHQVYILIGLLGAFSWLMLPKRVKETYGPAVNYLIPHWFLTFYFLPSFVFPAYKACLGVVLARWSGVNFFHVGDLREGFFFCFEDTEITELLLSFGFLLFVLISRHRQRRGRTVENGQGARLAVTVFAGWLIMAVPLHMIHVVLKQRFCPYDDLVYGNDAYLRGNLEEAEEHYLKALTIDPLYAEAHNILGVLYKRQGKLNEAVVSYSNALRINPSSALAHTNMGNSLAQLGRHKEAIDHYLEALRIRPKFASAHYSLGNAYLNDGRLHDAVKHYYEVLRIEPRNAMAHNNMGNALARLGRYTEAVACYGQALRIRPKFAIAHYNLGIVLKRLGRLEEAISHFSEVLLIKPDFGQARRKLESVLGARRPID